jgi:hypothetical protein
MPDQGSVSRVAKILARVTSSEPAESAASLQGAYKRMVRDGVSLTDLLGLPLDELYQDALVKLVDVILDNQGNLSPTARRDAYSQYMRLIVGRFSEDSGESGSSASGTRQEERDAEARRYEQRRGEQEAERGRGGASPPPSPPPKQDEKPFSRTNVKTSKWLNRVFDFRVGRQLFSFSPAGFLTSVSGLVGRGSITWHALYNPGRTLRLLAASMLYGCAFSGVLLSIAAALHALTGTAPLWDVKLKNAFAFLAAVGFLFKARQLFLAGWFR